MIHEHKSETYQHKSLDNGSRFILFTILYYITLTSCISLYNQTMTIVQISTIHHYQIIKKIKIHNVFRIFYSVIHIVTNIMLNLIL